MARYTGKDMYITFGGTDITGYFRVLEETEGQRNIDATAGEDDHEYHLGGVKHGGCTYTVLVDKGTAGTAQFAALGPGESGTLVYYPSGTATGAGNVKHTITDAEIFTRTHRLSYDAAVEVRSEFIYNVDSAVAAVT